MDLYSNTSFDPKMSSFSFKESPSSHFYSNFPTFVASQDSVFGESTQSNDTVCPYQASLTQTHSPFESTDVLEPPILQPNVTQMPPSPLVKCRWTEEEDMLLLRLVKLYGDKDWARVAACVPQKISKQCRDRWLNHLTPNIIKNAWSEEEDKLLISLHKEFGNKWTDIAKHMTGRTENNIKNHWNSTKRMKLRSTSRRKKTKDCHSLLKDYITSVCTSSSNHQTNIQTGPLKQAESFASDTPNDQSVMSLNLSSSSSTSFEVSYKPCELAVNKTNFDSDFGDIATNFDDVTPHSTEQLEFDQKNDTFFIDMVNFGIKF